MNITGPFFALIAFAVFAGHDVVIKVLGDSYTPFQIIFFASLFSFPLVTFMLVSDKSEGTLRPVHPWWTALRTFSATMTGLSAFYAFSVLPLAQVYVVIFASPLLITLLAIPMLGEKVGLHRMIAVLIGLAGVLVVLRPGVEPLTLGHLAALSTAVFNALASVIVRKIGQDERTVVLMLYPLVANFVAMGIALIWVYRPMPIEHLGGMGVISALAFIANLLMIGAYKRADAAIVAPMQYSQIIWAAIFGYAFFEETIQRQTLIGAVIIILSGFYIVMREARLGTASQTPVLQTRSRGPTAASFRISPLLNRHKARK